MDLINKSTNVPDITDTVYKGIVVERVKIRIFVFPKVSMQPGAFTFEMLE